MYKKLNYIFTKRDRYIIALLMIMILVGSFFELLGVAVFQPFINVIMNPDSIDDSFWLSKIRDLFNCETTTGFLTVLAILIIFIYVVKNVFLWIEQDVIMKFTYGIQQKLSTRLLTTYLDEPYTFHLNNNIAELQRSMQEDTGLFTQVLMHTLQLIAEVVVCIVLGIYLFDVSHSITTVIVGLLIVCVFGFIKLTKKFSENLGHESQIYKGKLYQWVNQSLGGVKEVKVLNREGFFVSSYQKYYKLYIKGMRLNKLIGITPKYLVEAVCMTGMLIAIIIKLNFGQKDMIDFIPQLATFAVAAFRLLPSVGRINEHVNNILYAVPSVDLIYKDLKGIEDYKASKTEDEGTVWKFDESIVAKDISYHYPNSDVQVLEKANCVIPKGKTVAFIGSSGAGKTTMADIILGLLEPQLGHILVDGLDVYKNLKLWHKHIGYIPQVIYLSDDTVRNNVAFGICEDEIDDNAVAEALRKAQLLDFVNSLPDGMDTMVGDRGVRLSGGQRQRIGIARALYHDPEILVLDEATSALDNETETAVMEAIESLQGTKTMLIIAHRLTTIRNADIVYEVGDGQVVKKDKNEVI